MAKPIFKMTIEAHGDTDIVLSYSPGERLVEVVGANVSDTIKRRSFRLGHPSISGFGCVRRAR